MPRRAVLHREHNALVHHKRGSLPESALSDEVRTEQDQAKGDPEDHHRVAPQHRDEPALELNVLEGKPRPIVVASLTLRIAVLRYRPPLGRFSSENRRNRTRRKISRKTRNNTDMEYRGEKIQFVSFISSVRGIEILAILFRSNAGHL